MTNQELLQAIESERENYASCDKELSRLVMFAQQVGIYPQETMAANPNDVLAMVKGWGAFWHQWGGQIHCAFCEADLRNHDLGPPFKREVGITNHLSDKTEYHQCPACSHVW